MRTQSPPAAARPVVSRGSQPATAAPARPTRDGRLGEPELAVSSSPPTRDGRSGEPALRGAWLLDRLDRGFRRLDAGIERFVPPAWNPLGQTGALANGALILAIVTGIVLLFWYQTSVHLAWGSVEAMAQAPWTAGLTRSLHRYSSDACVLLVALHALRLFAAGRFTGARWLAWVTGLAVLGLLWLVGWLGYWLVWDERAQLVALGTARFLDALPIFADPMERAFLADAHVNSLLFFVVFFFHMLVPLAMGVALWLHIARLGRPAYLPSRQMAVAGTVVLVALSVAFPATSEGPARMEHLPGALTLDAWYLAPLALTDRLDGATLWLLGLLGVALLGALPWTLARGRTRPALVDPSRCNACKQCVADCPYQAIAMVPRQDASHFDLQAQVDPARCVGCGICAGSCNSGGIGLPWRPAAGERAWVDRWISDELARGAAPRIAFVTGEGAGAHLRLDPDTGISPDLPGYRVLRVPCSGELHMHTVEHALKRGAANVLIAACSDSDCRFREGAKWTAERLAAARNPGLRREKIDPARLHVVAPDQGGLRGLQATATALLAGTPARLRSHGTWLRVVGALVLALGLGAGTWALSDVGYTAPRPDLPVLAVSFKHPGQLAERCRILTEAEKAKLPVHMRRDQVCERGRAPVRLRVTLDGRLVLDRAYAPRGLWSDGASIALERLAVPVGPHVVRVAVGDGADPNSWPWQEERIVDFETGRQHALLFDRASGFEWPQPGSLGTAR